MTRDPENDLFGRFSNGLHNSLLVQLEEIKGTTFHKNAGKFRDMITNNTSRLELKGIDKIDIDNLASFVCTTNNDNPLTISATDRRFCVFNVSEEMIGNVSYFDKFTNIMKQPDWGAAMFKYLKNLPNIPKSTIEFQKTRPNGEAYEDMRKQNIPTWARFFANKIMLNQTSDEDEKGNIIEALNAETQEIQASILYSEYCKYCTRTRNEQSIMKQTEFSLKLKTIQGLDKNKDNQSNKYTIKFNEVKQWLILKKYWDDEAIVTFI